MSLTVQQRRDQARQTVASMRVSQPAVPRPPGPHGLAAMARLATGSIRPHEFFRSVAMAQGPVAHIRFPQDRVYVLSSPEAIWEVFVGQGRNTTKSLALQMTRPLLGRGLLTSEGAEHMRNRRLIQPLFHRPRIAGYADDMVASAGSLARSWQDDQEVDVAEAMSALTLEIVGKTLFGTDLRADAPEVGDALEEVLHAFSRGLGPLTSPLSRIRTPRRRRQVAAIENLDGLVERITAEKRGQIAEGRPGPDLLTLLLTTTDAETGDSLSAEQVRDEAMTLVLAGHETTAMALTWAIYHLSRNPGAAAWLAEELASLPDRPLAFDDLPALPRTYAVVAEGMRLNPPAWVIGRWLSKDVRVCGWDLPRGSSVLASQYTMHRNPRYWSRSEEFVPQRWITPEGRFDERAPGQPRGVWFPFGFGTRRCIGDQFAWTEAVLVLATLLREWRIELVAPEEVRSLSAITLRPDVPVRAHLHRVGQ